jgi:hypothetical protein
MKKVFEYIYGTNYQCEIGASNNNTCPDCIECVYFRDIHSLTLDGNLMVIAKDKLVENGDWVKFIKHCYYRKYTNDEFLNDDFDAKFIAWLMTPKTFFDLLEKALEENAI